MGRVVQLAGFRPSPRHDEQPWTEVRIEETDDPNAGKWEEVEAVELEPLDEDATKPQLRSITTEKASKAWLRLVFLHEKGEDQPSPYISASLPPYLPTVSAVSSILRARTYDVGSSEVAGGDLLGEFGENTRPTAEQVEEEIRQAAKDVALELGTVPGELTEEVRRVTALKAAAEVERSYIPEQSAETQTIYQTLRLTYNEEVEKLSSTLQWWVLANQVNKQRLSLGWFMGDGSWFPGGWWF
jgi:hypothetical protein